MPVWNKSGDFMLPFSKVRAKCLLLHIGRQSQLGLLTLLSTDYQHTAHLCRDLSIANCPYIGDASLRRLAQHVSAPHCTARQNRAPRKIDDAPLPMVSVLTEGLRPALIGSPASILQQLVKGGNVLELVICCSTAKSPGFADYR